jgi:sec-independent protein translocase protein TatA
MLNSPVDIAVVLGVALLIFGPKKLPELGKALGQGIGNFKRSLLDAQDQLKHSFDSESKTEEKPPH